MLTTPVFNEKIAAVLINCSSPAALANCKNNKFISLATTTDLHGIIRNQNMAQLVLFFLLQLLPLPLPLTAMTSQFAHPAYDDSPLCDVSTDAELASDIISSSISVKLEEYGNGRIIDITHAYRPDMPAFNSTDDTIGMVVSLRDSMANGDLCNFSELKIGIHTGTHVDAPGHVYQEYYEAGFDVDTLDLEVLNGPALLVDVARDKNITAKVMESLHIPRGVRRVIFRTLNTDRKLMWKNKFDASYVGFMKDGAQWLVDNTNIKLVGVDYLSVAAFDDLIPAHLVFLKSREIILVEALKLDGVKPGIYYLNCLPLRLVGAEGSPIRCILTK